MRWPKRSPRPLAPQPTPDLLTYATLLDERDNARNYAQRVEEENALLLAALDDVARLIHGAPTTEEIEHIITTARQQVAT